MKERKIVFRCRGGANLGWGHVIRCLNFAHWLKGKYKVYFVVNQNPDVYALIKQHGFPIFEVSERGLPEKIEERVLNTIISLEPHIVINDIRNTTFSYMQALRTKGLKIVNFDDTSNNAKFAHVLIDANRKEKAGKLFGPAYIVLSSLYPKLAKYKRTIKKRVQTIVISMGGTDLNNLTEKTLHAFESKIPEQIQIQVIVGPSFTRKVKLKKWAERRAITFIEECKDLSQVFLEADIALVCGGITMFESLCVGTPTIVMAQDKPQAKNARKMERKGVVVYLGEGAKISQKKISRKTLALMNSFSERETLSRRAKHVVDGNGIFRALEQIELC